MVTKSLPYTIEAFGLSDLGLIRENNEDVWAIDCKENIFLLADGMGGHSAGEIAAKETVEKLRDLIRTRLGKRKAQKNIQRIRELIYEIIREANSAVYQQSRKEEGQRGMGTTLCCVYFHENRFVLAHVGDSRIYHWRGNNLRLLTQDHSLVCELMELGELNARQAREYAHRNIITKAVGTEPEIDPAVSDCDLAVGDQVMMCSDGLTDHLARDEIERIMNESPSIQESAQRMIDAANQRGGNDNITVVLMKVWKDDGRSNLS
jgi:protein phosphatase